jgi:hypothetical protein
MHATPRRQRQTNVKGFSIRGLRATIERVIGVARAPARGGRMEIAEWDERPATVAGWRAREG